jgi:radical SAM superfamily enzyme YgiQ (UPF0313 family)
MRTEGDIYRPPSEAGSLILQATVGCSWNRCTYCAMYRDKRFRIREVGEVLEDIADARRTWGDGVERVFVADGDALAMDTDRWEAILDALRSAFPRLRRVSAYATAQNLLDKPTADLARLADRGLTLLYIGPESGDPATLRRIAKGATAGEHVEAARRARLAGMDLSVIFLLGVAGVERSLDHARASAALASAMDPAFVALLTVTVIPGTPLGSAVAKGSQTVPDVRGLLAETRAFVQDARPTRAVFRANHASNYLPLGGVLPGDRERILHVLDAALAGRVPLRPEWARGL